VLELELHTLVLGTLIRSIEKDLITKQGTVGRSFLLRDGLLEERGYKEGDATYVM